MKRTVWTVVFSILVVGTPLAALAAQSRGEPARMPSARVGTQDEAKAARRAVLALHDELVGREVALGVQAPVTVFPAKRVDATEVPSVGPLKVGAVEPVAIDLRFDQARGLAKSDGVRMLRHGAIRRDADGVVWSSAVTVPGASGVRLHVTGLDLPEGARLAVYNERGEAFAYTGRGPFGDGEFWTNTVTGDTLSLQLSGADLSEAGFRIDEVGHLDEGWVFGAGSGLAKSFCSYNDSCIQNAGCGIDPPATDATDAVAMMLYVSGRYMYACSGGLLNSSSGRPYFLTANHCISKNNEASSLEAYFFYEIGCNAGCPAAWSRPSTPRTVGSSIVSSSRTSDYTLLELGQPAPAGAVLLGWNDTDIAFADGTQLYRISHPATAPQAYSTHTVDTSYGTCRSWPRGDWIYSRDTFGGTEGGSSGSPVVNGSGEVVGQLSGGCGTNVNDACDSVSNATVDGAFAAYYSQIAGVLGGGTSCDPVETCGDGIDNDCNGLIDDGCGSGGTCTDNDGDGWCVEDGDCDDTDSHVYPGHNDTHGRWGRDGVDNDCNGVIDG